MRSFAFESLPLQIQKELSQKMLFHFLPGTWGEETAILGNNEIDWQRSYGHLFVGKSAQSSNTADAPNIFYNDKQVQLFCRLHGTHETISLSFVEALECIGGLDCLFPVFAQLDQPVTISEYKFDPQLSISLTNLLFTLVRNSDNCRRTLQDHGGFAMISYFLENLDPRHMTDNLLEAIFDFYEKSAANYGFRNLRTSVISDLLINFKLWAYSPSTTQMNLISKLLRLVKQQQQQQQQQHNGGGISTTLRASFQQLLDSIHFVFYYQTPQLLSDSSESFVSSQHKFHHHTNELLGSRADNEKLTAIRASLWSLIIHLFSEAAPITGDEVKAIINFLIQTPPSDEKTKLEVLKLVLTLLYSDYNALPFVTHLIGSRGSPGFFVLINFVNDISSKVQNFSVAIVGIIIQVHKKHNAPDESSGFFNMSHQTNTSQLVKQTIRMSAVGLNFMPPPRMMRSISASSELTDSVLGRNSAHNLNLTNFNDMPPPSPTRMMTTTASAKNDDDSSSLQSSNATACFALTPIDLSTILRWMDNQLNEYRLESDFDESVVVGPYKPPSDVLIISSLFSIIFKNPQFEFMKQTAVTLKVFAFSTCSKKVEESFFLLSNNEPFLSEKKLSDLLYLLKDAINNCSDEKREINYDDISAEIERTFSIKLGSGGDKKIEYHEFFSWYRSVKFFSSAPQRIDDGCPFLALCEYLSHKTVDAKLRLSTLKYLGDLLLDEENCMLVTKQFGWEINFVKLISLNVDDITDLSLGMIATVHLHNMKRGHPESLKTTLSTFRYFANSGALQQGKRNGLQLLVNIFSKLSRVTPTTTLRVLIKTALDFIWVPHQANNQQQDIFTNRSLNVQFQLVHLLITHALCNKQAMVESMKISAEDILNTPGGLLRTLTISLESLFMSNNNCDTVSPATVQQGLVDIKALLCSFHLGENESVVTIVRLVELLRQQRGKPKNAGMSSLIRDLCEYFADVLWRDLAILKPNNLSNYTLAEDYFTPSTKVLTTKPSARELMDDVEEPLSQRSERSLSSSNDEILTSVSDGLEVDPSLIDWSVWDNAFADILSQSKRQEELSIVNRLDDLGYMEKNATIVGEKIASLTSAQFHLLNDFTENTRSKVFSLTVSNETRVSTMMSLNVTKKNLARERWEGILRELANERGPWGQQEDEMDSDQNNPDDDTDLLDEEDQIIMRILRRKKKKKYSAYFWIQDDSISFMGLKLKFKQNTVGSQHRACSERTSSSTASALLPPRLTRSSSSTSVITTAPLPGGLMNDLKKYQRRATMSKFDDQAISNVVQEIRRVDREDKADETHESESSSGDDDGTDGGEGDCEHRSQSRQSEILSTGNGSSVASGVPKCLEANETSDSDEMSSIMTTPNSATLNRKKVKNKVASPKKSKKESEQGRKTDTKQQYQNHPPRTVTPKPLSTSVTSTLSQNTTMSFSNTTTATRHNNKGNSSNNTNQKQKVHFFKMCTLMNNVAKSAGDIELINSTLNFQTNHDYESSETTPPSLPTSWSWIKQELTSYSADLRNLTDIYSHVYRQANLAVEFVFKDSSTIIVAFDKVRSKDDFLKIVLQTIKPPKLNKNCKINLTLNPRNVMLRTKIGINNINVTKAWVNREISTFEYLLALNRIAGRSFNDLSQYPVFPWVLSNYHSKTINLRDPSNYRDFRWPMGAQTAERRKKCNDRFAALSSQLDSTMIPDDNAMPPFHHGSHYSCPGFVIWYLMRMEPYTSLHLDLQGNKFDKPDRLFRSIEGAFKGVMNNQGDVKELIPEFFCMPEFLTNHNCIDLGECQDGEKVNDVKLPPWANNDPFEFVRINREALESEHVSANLHHWIDLIFGYKNRPPAAGGAQASVDSYNVFFHLTYPNAVDLDRMRVEDPGLHDTYVKQIDNYGQTPSVLFTKPHPQRNFLQNDTKMWPLISNVYGSDQIDNKFLSKPTGILAWDLGHLSCSSICCIMKRTQKTIVVAENENDFLLTIDVNKCAGYHSWVNLSNDITPQFKFQRDGRSFAVSKKMTRHGGSNKNSGGDRNSISTARGSDERLMGGGVGEQEGSENIANAFEMGGKKFTVAHRERIIGSSLLQQSPSIMRAQTAATAAAAAAAATASAFQVMDTPSTTYIFSCENNSIHVTDMSLGRVVQTLSNHTDTATCLKLLSDVEEENGDAFLVTGSKDCTVKVFEIEQISKKKDEILNVTPLHTLFGHDGGITCIDISINLDMIVSSSEDGTIIIHSLKGGKYRRTIEVVGAYEDEDEGESGDQGDDWTYKNSNLMSNKIVWVGLSSKGYIVAHVQQSDVWEKGVGRGGTGSTLYVYSINGKLLATRTIKDESINSLVFSKDGEILITGGTMKKVRFFVLRNLTNLTQLPHLFISSRKDSGGGGEEATLDGYCSITNTSKFDAPVTSLMIRENNVENFLVVGLENGRVYVFVHDLNYLRKRLHKKLENLGFF